MDLQQPNDQPTQYEVCYASAHRADSDRRHWKKKGVSIVRSAVNESRVRSELLYLRAHTVRLDIIRYVTFRQQPTDGVTIQEKMLKTVRLHVILNKRVR